MPAPRNRFRLIAKAAMALSLVLLLVMMSGLAAPEAKAQDAEEDYGSAAAAVNNQLLCVALPNYLGGMSPSTVFSWFPECRAFDIIKARIASARGAWQFIVVRTLLSVMHNAVIAFSQQMANWAISGFHGKPAFYEKGWGGMLKDVTLEIVNRFIDDADKNWGLNLCQEPDFAFKLSLGLGTVAPLPPPVCTLQTIAKYYEAVYRSLTPREVATTLFKSIDIGGNDLDYSLRAQSLLTGKIEEGKLDETKTREENKGFMTVKKGPLSALIKTPAAIVQTTIAESNIAKTTNDVTVAEMSTLAMEAMWAGIEQLPLIAGMTVLSTVANALLQKALNALMEPTGSSTDVQAIDLTNPYAETQNQPKGKSALQKAFTDIITPNLITQDKLDLVTEMSFCPETRSYWNCTIDEGLASALRNSTENGAYTVLRATGAGGGTQYLNPEWELVPVTETKDDQDPGCYQRAYCSSNLAKMRFARMLPMGWELAANSPFNLKTNGKYVTLGEVMAGFNDCAADSTKPDAQHKWCHLIDPAWVLTSPPFICQEKGYGDTLQVPDMMLRIQECSDLVSCLKRDDKGVCTGGYGYCLSDKTVWRFGADACDEKFVSCRTYKSRPEGFQQGKDVSYIRNSIDYGACNQDNVGCMYYATLHDTSTTTTGRWANNVELKDKTNIKGLVASVNLDKSGTPGTPRVYFDSSVQPCDASADGCTRVMQTVPGQPALNLVRNGSFESTLANQPDKLDGWVMGGASQPFVLSAFQSDNGLTSQDGSQSQEFKAAPDSNHIPWQWLRIYPTRNYVLSFYARANDVNVNHIASAALLFYTSPELVGQKIVKSGTKYGHSSNCNDIQAVPLNFDATQSANVGGDSLTGDWQRFTCEFVSNKDANYARIFVSGSNAVVDSVQLEEADAATDFTDGLAGGLKANYLKLASEEYLCTGDEKVDRKECANFAQVCRQTDAGCQGYTEVGGGDQTEIPAILSSNDACPNTCVGYAEYRKLPSAFDLINTGAKMPASDPLDDPNDDSKAIFVPKYALACSAAQAGCEEFTNVESAAAGGEEKIYLNYARACQKPSDKSQTYFTWEGSDTTGYQLRTWSLIKESGGGPQLLLKAGSDGILKDPADCNPVAWKQGMDSDCRQFYNESGTAYYSFFSQTIVSSVDCTDYRKNNSNADDCGKTGGDFKQNTSDCIYHILQSESGKCDAANAGCRGYLGTTGRNTATVLNETFVGTTSSQFYTKDANSILKISAEALLVGDHSLQVGGKDVLTAKVDFEATTNTLYTVSFWLKSLPQNPQDMNKTVNIKLAGFSNGSGYSDIVGNFKASNDWRRFEIGPFRAKATGKTTLTWEGLPNVSYLDNVSILRQQDVVYVNKEKWAIPAECDQTAEGIPQPQAMLGCREFRDRLGRTNDVRQFSRLCRYQDIGCSAFVDTRNSDSAYGQNFALKGLDKPAANGKLWDTLYSGTVTVNRPADRYVYVIDDPSAHCTSDQMSCRAFGKPKFDSFGVPTTTYETVYFKDDITKYTDAGGEPNMLCRPSELSCDKFTSGPLVSFFRDPFEHTVEWRDKVTTSSTSPKLPEGEYSGWFVTNHEPPTAGYPEKQSSGNTFRLEYAGAPNYRGWTAQCPVEQSECTEYRDPADSTDQAHPLGKPYFFIANDTLDRSSCNGKVDLLSGCVLFRDMNVSSLPFSTGGTYAKAHAQGDSAVSPLNCVTDPDSSYCATGGGRCTNLRITGCGPSGGCANNEGQNFVAKTLGAACGKDADCSHDSKGDPSSFDVLGSCQKNDANLIIKVKMDRDCQTWLGCSSAETVYDPSQQKYTDLCTNLAVCDQVGGTSNKNFCGHYVDRIGGADQVLAKGRFLDIGNYMSRPTGYGKPDYAGYSIPNHFQVADLGMRRMGYELLVNRPSNVKDKLYNDFRLTAAIPYSDKAWGAEDLIPSDKNYPYLNLCRQKQTGLIGYYVQKGSSPKDLHVKAETTPTVCYVSIDKPYTTLLHAVMGQVSSNPSNAQQVATTFEQSQGTVKDKVLDKSFPPVECRAHPDGTAPFGNQFVKEWDMTVDPPKPKKFIDGYDGVNYCEYGENCDCSYRKVSYSGKPKYYSAFGGGVPAGVCVGGQDDGKSCDPGIVVSEPSGSVAPATTKDDLEKSNPALPSKTGEANPNLNTCRQGGCVAYSSDSLVRGVPGQCLLRDYGRKLGGAVDMNPCLIWNPTPVLVGQDDRYHYQPSAGYLPPANSGEYYCLSNAREPRKLASIALNCTVDQNFSPTLISLQSNKCYPFKESYVAPAIPPAKAVSTPPGSIIAQPPGKMTIFSYDECSVMDARVVSTMAMPTPFRSLNIFGTAGDWYRDNCGQSFSTLDGVPANGGESGAACSGVRNSYGPAPMAVDRYAGRWVTTGRGASHNYAEYFIKFNPTGWAKWLLGASSTTPEQVKQASLESNFTYFKFKPMYITGAGGTWACGSSGWWVDEFPVTQNPDGWNQAGNTFVKNMLKDLKDLTPQGFGYLMNEKGTKLERLPCAFKESHEQKPPDPADEGLCYYKYWQMDFHGDGQKKFRMFYDSFGGPQMLDPANVLFAESDASKPFFAIRAMFEDTLPEDNAVPTSQMDPSGIQLGGPFRFVGWWVTATMPGSTSEDYIYMNMDVGNADICREVARVKSPDTKETAAFTDRVWESGNFSLPVLGFTFSQGSAPFGAALNTRDIGQEPLYQLGLQNKQQTYKAGVNRPTFLASGASYSRTLSMPTANWGYLTNLFAKVYQVYRYQDQPVGPGSWACTDGPRFGSKCPDMSTEMISTDFGKSTHYKDAFECKTTGCSFPLKANDPNKGGTSAPDVSVKYCGWAGTCNTNAVDLSQGQALCNSLSGVNAGLACSGSLGGAQSYHICHLAPVKSINGELVPQYTSCGIASGWEQVEDSEGNLQELYRKTGTACGQGGSGCWGRKSAAQKGAFQCASGAVTMPKPDEKLAWCRADSGGKPSPDCPLKVVGGKDSSCDCDPKVNGICQGTSSGKCTGGYEQAACKKDSDCQFTWLEWWGVDFNKNSGPPDKPQWYYMDTYAKKSDGKAEGVPYLYMGMKNNSWAFDVTLAQKYAEMPTAGVIWWVKDGSTINGNWKGTDLQDAGVDIARKDLSGDVTGNGTRTLWRNYPFGVVNSENRFPGVYAAGSFPSDDTAVFIPAHCERPPIEPDITNSAYVELCKKVVGEAQWSGDCAKTAPPDVPYFTDVRGFQTNVGLTRFVGDPNQPWKSGVCEYGIYENRSCSRDQDCAPALLSTVDQHASSFYCNPVTKKEGGKTVPNTGGVLYSDASPADVGFWCVKQGLGTCTNDIYSNLVAYCKANQDKCSDVSRNCLATTGDPNSKDLDKDNNMCTHYSGYYPRPDICGGDIGKSQCLTGIKQNDPDVKKSFDLSKVSPPTDVSSGLHLPPYLASKNKDKDGKFLDSNDYTANYSYIARYAPRPPMIAAPDTSKQCPSPGQCPISQVGAFSLEGSSEGKVAYVGGQVQTNIRFYGWAADNQMGLKDLWLDWGDSVIQEYHDARMKNKKPICGATKECEFIPGLGCNTDNDCPPAGGKCSPVGSCAAKPQVLCTVDQDCYEGGMDVGDKCASRLTFGNSSNACEANYFDFTHVYTCPRGAATLLKTSCLDANGAEIKRCSRDNDRTCASDAGCAVGDKCLAGMAPPDGCYDATNNACRFTPRLLLKDNWGWCAGECRQENLGAGKLGMGFNAPGLLKAGIPTYNNILLPNGGCYDATGVTLNKDPAQDLVVGVQNGTTGVTNMCDPTATASTDYRPWIVFKGAMQLGVAQ